LAVGRGGLSDHIVLADRSDENRTPLKILTDENGALLYQSDLAPALAPDVPAPDVRYGQYEPDLEITWSQYDWSQGGLKFYYDANIPGQYGLADKVWPATSSEIGLGYSPKSVTFGVRNGGCQLAATTGWSVSGTTITAVTTAPHAGSHHFQLASMSTNDYAQITIQQTEQPVARWVSQAITVTAMVRGSAAGGQVRMQIVESGGSSTPTTSGSAATLTTSYQNISASVTTQSDTTGIVIRVEMSADGGEDRTVYFDSAQCLAGTAIPNASNCKMQYLNGDLLALTDRAVWKFDETSDYWCLQKVHGAAITGTMVFDDRLYIGQGESTAYQYSDAQDATSWTAASGSGTNDNANRFTKALNVSGNWAAVKSLNDDEIYLTTDPTGSASWGSAIEVGKDDHNIIQLYQIDGTIAVGKEDGFYQYLTLDGNRFANVFPDAEVMVDSQNFDRGVMYQGMFYTVIGEVGFVRYNGEVWQRLGKVVQSPGFSDVGSRIRAFGTDGNRLYALVEDLNADSITKTCWLFSLEEAGGGEWSVHTLATVVLSDALDMFVFKPSGGTNRFLFINGDVNDVATCYRILLPNRTDTPRLATNADAALSGTLVTSYWDGNRPQVKKSAKRLTINSENLNASRSITVAYQVDDDTSWTDINSDSSVFTTSSEQITAFDEGVEFYRIRLRFTFSSDSSTNSPVMKAFAMDLDWRPRRLRRWRLTAALEDGLKGLQGVVMALPPRRALQQLRSLQQQISPIIIEDIDGVTQRCHIVDMIETSFRTRSGKVSGGPSYSRGVSLLMVQALALSGEAWNSGIRWNEFAWG